MPIRMTRGGRGCKRQPLHSSDRDAGNCVLSGLQRAKEGEGLEEIRERTAEKFERRSQAESQQGRHAKRQKIA